MSCKTLHVISNCPIMSPCVLHDLHLKKWQKNVQWMWRPPYRHKNFYLNKVWNLLHKVHHFLMNYRCKVWSFFLNESQLFIYKIKLYQLFTHVRISKGTILRTQISHFPLSLGVVFTQEPNLVFGHMPQEKIQVHKMYLFQKLGFETCKNI